MRHLLLTIFLTTFLCGGTAEVEVFFSPNGGCTQAIVREIGAAKKSVRIQAYSFTSKEIAKAAVDAHRRGVLVEAILDKSQDSGKYSSLTFLVNSGVPVWIDRTHAIAHNKVIIVDDSTVLTGSFNFTQAAEKSNAENLVILRSPDLAMKYDRNWITHRDHSDQSKR